MNVSLAEHLRLHRQFHSRFLRRDRDLIVFLPPGYEVQDHRRYPVCYLHDGQNLFDPASSFLGVAWGVGEIALDLIKSGLIEPLIIVGIYNAGETRRSEYTHVPDTAKSGGLADSYGKAIMRDIKPFIDKQYRTLPDSSNTALGGSSLGGLVSAYLGIKFPGVFGKLIVMSPSVWWADRDILQRVREHGHNIGQKVWLDMGTSEEPNPQLCVDDARRLRDALLEAGWRLGEDLSYQEEEGGEHNERAWGRRMRGALRFLFPASDTLINNVR